MERICAIENEKVCKCCCRKKLFYRCVIVLILATDVVLLATFAIKYALFFANPETSTSEQIRSAKGQAVFCPVYVPWIAKVGYGVRWMVRKFSRPALSPFFLLTVTVNVSGILGVLAISFSVYRDSDSDEFRLICTLSIVFQLIELILIFMAISYTDRLQFAKNDRLRAL